MTDRLRLTPLQRRALAHLADGLAEGVPWRNAAFAADDLARRPRARVDALERLAARGLARRRPPFRGRTAATWRITEAGLALAARLDEEIPS